MDTVSRYYCCNKRTAASQQYHKIPNVFRRALSTVTCTTNSVSCTNQSWKQGLAFFFTFTHLLLWYNAKVSSTHHTAFGSGVYSQ